MSGLELRVLNGDQAGMVVALAPGTYRIVRRSDDPYSVRTTLVSSRVDQWRLTQEDLELASRSLAEVSQGDGSNDVSFEAFERSDDVAIYDEHMSQPHAIVLCSENRATVVDMGSRNGTFVNGERVGAADLANGDLVRFGATRMLVHLE